MNRDLSDCIEVHQLCNFRLPLKKLSFREIWCVWLLKV